jgi:hypothetical protein
MEVTAAQFIRVKIAAVSLDSAIVKVHPGTFQIMPGTVAGKPALSTLK